MDIIAKILRLENVEHITEKFKKRRIIVEYAKNENYPQTIEFALVQNNISLADGLNTGDEIKLMFDLKGRESIDKNGIKRVYNTLEVWRVEMIKKSIDFVETPVEDTENKYSDDQPLPF